MAMSDCYFTVDERPKVAGEAKRRFQRIQEAYSVLSDKGKRTVYEAGLLGFLGDDDDEGLCDFMQEMVFLMQSENKRSQENNSLEDLQGLLRDMINEDKRVKKKGVGKFAQEIESPIAPGRLFKALILDCLNLYTKLMPHGQSIISVDTIQGDGGVGTIKQINFTQVMEGGVLKEKLMTSMVYDFEFVDDGHGGCVCKKLSQYYTEEDVSFSY
ncbi:Bet v I type allergen [Parasponia andersonii]|uniref:Bet v I type allergen n=1 Tax=Parasponia andersonii TaxID=3476 RepID=A0A2P5AVH4_PARAD|nr:Bet v I type allergen [Parasponia andersonii]